MILRLSLQIFLFSSWLCNFVPARRLRRRYLSVAALEATREAHAAHVVMKNTNGKSASESTVIPKVYESWPSQKSLPCFPAEENWETTKVQSGPIDEGLLYMKLYKTGSSTTSGIHLRIARNLANRTGIDQEVCKSRFDHGPWVHPSHRFRDRKMGRSFLWTVLRDPTQRLISSFFFMQVSRGKIEPTDKNFLNFLQSDRDMKVQYYLRALETGRYNITHRDFSTVANQIMQDYDFIGVTERMDETAVLIMMLLDLPMADILFLSAKHRGSYEPGGEEGRCTYIWPSFLSPSMKDFFDSREWQELIRIDQALYLAANQSMDLTIDRLGRDKFEATLIKFKNAQKYAEDKCLQVTRFPCSESGESLNHTDCIWRVRKNNDLATDHCT